MKEGASLEAQLQQSERSQELIEICLWILAGFIVSGRMWLEIYNYEMVTEVMFHRYIELLLGLLCVLFPILYRLIFGLFPVQYMRRRLSSRWERVEEGPVTAPDRVPVGYAPAPTAAIPLKAFTHDTDPQTILATLVESSRKLSNQIFTRAGVYLMIGVLIAFSGLAFFYTQTVAVRELASNQGGDLSAFATRQISLLAPRFGVLFFIEFIAFFFLRQYRSAMEEFRYFEAIQRKREETFALVRFMKEEEGKVNISDLVKAESFFSGVEKLGPGESTELLESRKVTKDEMDVFMKIVETVAQSKK